MRYIGQSWGIKMNILAIGNEYLDAVLYDQNRWKGKVNFDTYFTIT